MRDRANIRKAIAHARYVSRAQRTDRAAEHAIQQRGNDKSPQRARAHEARDEYKVVPDGRFLHADRAESAAHRRPIGNVLCVGQRQQDAGTQGPLAIDLIGGRVNRKLSADWPAMRRAQATRDRPCWQH